MIKNHQRDRTSRSRRWWSKNRGSFLRVFPAKKPKRMKPEATDWMVWGYPPMDALQWKILLKTNDLRVPLCYETRIYWFTSIRKHLRKKTWVKRNEAALVGIEECLFQTTDAPWQTLTLCLSRSAASMVNVPSLLMNRWTPSVLMDKSQIVPYLQ